MSSSISLQETPQNTTPLITSIHINANKPWRKQKKDGNKKKCCLMISKREKQASLKSTRQLLARNTQQGTVHLIQDHVMKVMGLLPLHSLRKLFKHVTSFHWLQQ
jgi:hypothetical protein